MAEKKTKRVRSWTFIVYPESAPDGWLEMLAEDAVPGYVSPLHDADLNPDGEAKKAHWHVVLCFSGPKTLDQVREVTSAVNGTEPQPVKDMRGMARYLCHLDNPEKHQYDVDDVVSLGGLDYLAHLGSDADVDQALSEVMAFCRDNCVYSFADLCDFAAKHHRDWFRVITAKRTRAVIEYLKSLKWTDEQAARVEE